MSKKPSLLKDAGGIAHLGLILLFAGVVAVGGFAVWRISSYNSEKKNESSNSQSDSSKPDTTALSAECVAQTGDENICRFGAITDLSQFASEVKLTMDGEGGALNSTIKYDGKGNSFVDLGTGMQSITVGGKNYVYMFDKWYDTGNDTSQVPDTAMPSLGFATTAGITYENQGKVPCGNDTCFKYRMSGGILGDGVVVATFGDKDYLPRRLESTGGMLGKMTMTVEYKDVSIAAPEGALPIDSLYQGGFGN